METLESYLSSDFISQDQEVRAIDRTLSSVAEMFTLAAQGGRWNYDVKLRDLEEKIGPFGVPKSHGTKAMILSSLGVLTGDCQSHSGSSADLKELGSKELKKFWDMCFTSICTDFSNGQDVFSSTFGKADILTVSHICELIDCLEDDHRLATEGFLKKLCDAVDLAFRSDLDNTMKDVPEAAGASAQKKYQKNAFVMLRAIRAQKILGRACLDFVIEAEKIKTFRVYFESTLHDHLSFSSIPDSRFDPAELIFCLEGLLLCSREAVDTTLLKRVLEVLSDKQSSNSHWRANKPFMTGDTGAIHLPLSVEGANSLMRSVDIMDEHRHFNTYTAMALPLIARFWTWLRARSVRADVDGKACVGWHSEHVNTPDVIHLWDTAMVAQFMYSYREMLERHMADKSLHLAGLDIVRPLQKKDVWTETCKTFEPLLDDKNDKRAKVYWDAKTDFIDGWLNEKPKNFSILLYGPPGTGKSTFAKNMARALGFPFITVTVSDFLGSGGENVEARAKAVFKTLEMQKKCVILFDEIDSFLLDRNSKRYGKQDSLFQFLTPGMLTKINDLRKLKRSIFIIATNYEKRIDAAIKRTGRVDKKYLLGLPNAALRAKILGISKEKFEDHLNESSALFAFEDLMGAKNDAVSDNKEFENVLDDLETAEEELKNAEVAKNTSPSYSSNQAVIDAKEIISKLQKKTQEFQLSISEKLNRREPPTSVKNYLELISANEKFPEEELEGLLFLIKEAHSPNENQSEDLGATKTAPLAKIDRVKGISRLDEELQKLLEDLGLPKKRREKKC